MSEEKKLDQAFFKGSKAFFLKFHEQVTIITSVFSEVANAFPQKVLKKYFLRAKGCKISKGNQLEGLPYQVLDIVRDFDADHGFNIRWLYWWGVGLFVFVTYGKTSKKAFDGLWLKDLKGFYLSSSPSPFDYQSIIQEKTPATIEAINSLMEDQIQIQLWKVLNTPENPEEAVRTIKKITEDILSYHFE